MKEKYYCPVNGFDCPYFGEKGECHCENPLEECDDAMEYEEGFLDGETIVFYAVGSPPQD